jgi:predicted RNA binding protein YcfA (HicA-like mRNA interferase family)
VSVWPSCKAARVLRAIERIGWVLLRVGKGSHRIYARQGWPNFIWAFHDRDEIGPRMLARIARKTGLTPGDL